LGSLQLTLENSLHPFIHHRRKTGCQVEKSPAPGPLTCMGTWTLGAFVVDFLGNFEGLNNFILSTSPQIVFILSSMAVTEFVF
jgi:hypothetical protein